MSYVLQIPGYIPLWDVEYYRYAKMEMSRIEIQHLLFAKKVLDTCNEQTSYAHWHVYYNQLG